MSKRTKGFEKLVDNAADVFTFKWSRLQEHFKANETFAGRKNAIEEFLQTIATSLQAGNLSAIERGLIVNRLSAVIGIAANQINHELNKNKV